MEPISKSWYGYIYTKNDSKIDIEERITQKFTGISIVWPP